MERDGGNHFSDEKVSDTIIIFVAQIIFRDVY